MTRLAMLFVLFALLTGCRSLVGDSCTADQDCGSGLFCESSMPGGYCTRRSCTDRACPSESICVRFDLDTSFCMRACNAEGDCRSDYTCVEDFAAYGFCSAAEAP